MVKIKYSDLKQLQPIEKIIIYSMDLAIYQAFIVIDNNEHLIYDDNKRPLRTMNLTEMRKKFKNLTINAFELRQQSAYDEMINVSQEKVDNTLSIPLSDNLDYI